MNLTANAVVIVVALIAAAGQVEKLAEAVGGVG